MATYANATVFFQRDFSVGVGDFVYAAEMNGLAVRVDGDWVHVKSDEGEPRVDSFPAWAVRCIAWDEEPVIGP